MRQSTMSERTMRVHALRLRAAMRCRRFVATRYQGQKLPLNHTSVNSPTRADVHFVADRGEPEHIRHAVTSARAASRRFALEPIAHAAAILPQRAFWMPAACVASPFTSSLRPVP